MKAKLEQQQKGLEDFEKAARTQGFGGAVTIPRSHKKHIESARDPRVTAASAKPGGIEAPAAIFSHSQKPPSMRN
jgi:hypothetical protein